jgi:hypothetical protein
MSLSHGILQGRGDGSSVLIRKTKEPSPCLPIWQYYLDALELLRKTDYGKELYAQRKETIERVFADAKEKHAMRYTHRRSLARVTSWVRLKYAAMNLKKLAKWSWNRLHFARLLPPFSLLNAKTPRFA